MSTPTRVLRWIAPMAGAAIVLPFAGYVCAAPAVAVTAGAATATAVSSAGTKPPAFRSVQSEPAVPNGARAIGAMPSSSTITGAVVLKPSDSAALDAFISEVSNKGSAEYHQYLTPAGFRSRFGPAQSTISAVEHTLRAGGLNVRDVANDGLVISFSGSTSSVEGTFHTGLERYALASGAPGQATTSAVELPSSVASYVTSVVGLDDLTAEQPQDLTASDLADAVRPPTPSSPAPPAKTSTFTHPAGSPTPCGDATSDALDSGGLTDDQIANAYGAFGLYNSGDFGAGQHIAVFEMEPFLMSDLQTFDACYFGTAAASQMLNRVSVIPVDGGQPTGPGSGEAILDVEDVSAIAPQADLDVYEAPNSTFGYIDEMSQIVNTDWDQIITSSWGNCEQAEEEGAPGVLQAENVLFEQAAAQGQTMFAAAGDEGSDDCNAFDQTSPVTPILSVEDPASQPYVVAVGGTTIDDATQPPLEHVWNDGSAGGSGGGGISQSWAMPAWQLDSRVPGIDNSTAIDQADSFEATDLGQPGYQFCPTAAPGGTGASACRELPDVSAQADEFTGAVTIYGSQLGYGPPDGWVTTGGTSSATPIWAALLALINESPTCSSEGLSSASPPGVGFALPQLYALASNPAAYASSFTDITSGDNDPFGTSGLFPATTGYDMASGLGSPEVTGPGGSAGLAAYLCRQAVSKSAPTVSALSPTSGPTSGSFNVAITGTGFETTAGSSDVADVQVGTVRLAAGSYTVGSATQITARFPSALQLAGADDTTDGAGAYQVTVTLADGETSRASVASTFDYVDENGSSQAIPDVTGVRTYTGPEAGGNVVDVFGTGFTGATGVTFGGVAATAMKVISDFEIQASAPAFSTGATKCAQDGASFATGETASDDICQVSVVVVGPHGPSGGGSATSCTGPSGAEAILPFFEGTYNLNATGVVPAPAGQEVAPMPCEYDYLPAPTVTSISTSSGPADYASEAGGTLVTIRGSGFNYAGFDWVNFGPSDQATSQSSPLNLVTETGTEIQLFANGLPAPTVDAVSVPVTVQTVAGLSSPVSATYAGIPTVTGVVNSTSGKDGAPDTGGTPITISGQGLEDADMIVFADTSGGPTLGTQSVFTPSTDSTITTKTVPVLPGIVDTLVCTATSCSEPTSAETPPSMADVLYLYPPGNPVVDSVAPTSGPGTGGTSVTIEGQNLGCATGVFFGSVPAATFSNTETQLDCGSTSQVQVTSPPGTAGTTVAVRVTTLESDFSGSGPSQSTATFTYTRSAPKFTADTPPGRATTGIAYGPYTFKATGSPAPTFSLDRGFATCVRGVTCSLPPGLSLNPASGALSGTPTRVGTFAFVVEASNGVAPSALSAPITIVVSASETGYRLVTSYGHVYSLGSDSGFGSLAVVPASPVVGMASSGSEGYWMVTAGGTVVAFGDAHNYGSVKGHLNQPIVGIASTPDARGYWLVAADGGVFTFGDAAYFGSMGNHHLNKPIVGIAAAPGGAGYWLVAADGGVFTFGKAGFFGSMGGTALAHPVVGIDAGADGGGYGLATSSGEVFGFGDFRSLGTPATSGVVGITS